MMNYSKILRDSFAAQRLFVELDSRLVFLAETIFGLTTYDPEMSELFGRKAVEVCKAINDRATFDFIEDKENYKWFLLMCNMPFFSNNIDWGSSIRGAWWNHCEIEIKSTGLWDGGTQLSDNLKFTEAQWNEFIEAIIEFAKPEMEGVVNGS